MKIFVDSADLNEIKSLELLGVVDGITTNPSLLLKSGIQIEDFAQQVFKIVDVPVSLEVIAVDSAQMVEEARKLSKIHENVVVKIPCTDEGLKAIKTCSKEGIKTNCTLVFSLNQAILVAKAGATYVSPFVGRLDDIGEDGMKLIDEIVQAYDNYGYETEIIVASVRSLEHIKKTALSGAEIATIPPKLIHEMIKHPKTDEGLKKFLDDWKQLGGKI